MKDRSVILVQMPITCDLEDRQYFESVCEKMKLTKREFLHELIENYKQGNKNKKNDLDKK